MKRTAAVLGPTPPFVRWAIDRKCALRDTDVDNLADQTFRQLRNLRELSNGYRQHRVLEDICVHPAPIADTSQLRAFHAQEVFDYFGDGASLALTCGPCPANCLMRTETDWAGCFGLLPVNLNFHFGHTANSQVLPEDNLAALVDEILQQPLGFYKLWTQQWFDQADVQNLATIFAQAARLRPKYTALAQFADACQRCVDHAMKLHVELVPAGFSDGIDWRIRRACHRCRYHGDAVREKGTPCPVCGSRHADDSGRKAKVLGLRPYLLLQRIIGEASNEAFSLRYQQHIQKRSLGKPPLEEGRQTDSSID
jgi:hypothetical protein